MNEYGLFRERLAEAGFTEEQVVKIVEVYESVCSTCLDNNRRCYCWNDE